MSLVTAGRVTRRTGRSPNDEGRPDIPNALGYFFAASAKISRGARRDDYFRFSSLLWCSLSHLMPASVSSMAVFVAAMAFTRCPPLSEVAF